MGGPSKSTIKRQDAITDKQVQIAEKADARADEQHKQFKEDIAPARDFYGRVAKGGSSLMTAIAPIVTRISTGQRQAEEAIFDTMPAGPGRDLAIADNKRQAYSDVAATKNFSFIEALDKLANIGSGLGSFSLQNTGAALSGTNSAGSNNAAVLQAQAAAKASRMGFLGELAGAGGTFAGLKMG